MESIVSLERGVCSCAKLQVFSYYRSWKEACQVMRAISTTLRRELSSGFFFFPARQGAKGDYAILTETLGEHASSYATIRNWVAQFKHDHFSTCDVPRPGWPKTMTTWEIIDQIHKLILEDHQILAKSIAKQLGISYEQVRSIIHEDLDMPKLSAKWAPKCLNVNGASRLSNFWNLFGSARSKWFPVAIGDHGWNLVMSLWPRDKAAISRVAA